MNAGKLVAIARVDGGIELMRLHNERGQMYDPTTTVEKEIEKWNSTHPGQYVSHTEIDEEQVPQDRYFRNAWKTDLKVDMTKARDIHRDKLRALRAPKFVILDIAYQLADEQGDVAAKQVIAVKKQALRDVPTDPAIDMASTPADLKAVLPAALQ